MDGFLFVSLLLKKVSYSHELAMSMRLVDSAYLTWLFDWEELDKKGIDGFTGCITVSILHNHFKTPPQKYFFDVTRDIKSIKRRIGSVPDLSKHLGFARCELKYAVSLRPFRLLDRCLDIDTQFNRRQDTDLILEVEGFQLHLNSHFLRVHSSYFSKKLAAYVMNAFLPDVDLQDVRYDVFARLIAMVHPESILPSEEFFDSILELAEQLSMPAISRLIQQMIQRESHLNFYEVLTLADKYRMDDLVDTCITYITSGDHLNKMKKMENFKLLSADTKNKIFDKFLEL